jgi:hypothetical protein
VVAPDSLAGSSADAFRMSPSGSPASPAARSVSLSPRAAVASAVLAIAIFAIWVGTGFGGEQVTLYVNDIATIVAALAASLLCFRAAVGHAGALRRFWWLLGAACTAWMLGELIWAVYELALRDPIPVPSWADLGYLGAIPLAVGALLSHPAMAGTAARRARFTLEGLLVATALLFLSWTLVLGPLWHNTDVTTLAGLVAIAYPFGDVVVVFFVILAVRRMASGHRLALGCLLGGVLALALSDSVYAYLTGVQGYETGGLLDAGWFAGYLAIAVGAFCSPADSAVAHEEMEGEPAFAALVVPFMPIVAALGVMALKPGLVEELDPVAFTTAFALVALTLGRQLLVMRELAARAGQSDGVPGDRVWALMHTPLTGRSKPSAAPPPIEVLHE